jgi:hypothetical protein
VTLVAWWFAWQQMSSAGIPGVSHLIGLVFGLGGTVTLTLLSLYSIRRLWRNHLGDRLFRNGPLAAEM